MIIGLGHRARSGKDTIAKRLQASHGFHHTWFAQPLKEAAGRLFGLSNEQLYGELKEAEDPFWKDTPRNILQKFGTECMRNGYRKDFWVKVMERRIDNWRPTIQDIVVSDVRFPEEAEMILRLGGELWRVDRPGAPDMGAHPSEHALDDWGLWHLVLENKGTVADLEAVVDRHAARIKACYGSGK